MAYWKSFGLIAVLCLVLAFLRNRLVKNKLRPADVGVHAAFSAIITLFIVMLVNRMGFDYGYLDEVLVSVVYVALGPPKFIYDAIRESEDRKP